MSREFGWLKQGYPILIHYIDTQTDERKNKLCLEWAEYSEWLDECPHRILQSTLIIRSEKNLVDVYGNPILLE